MGHPRHRGSGHCGASWTWSATSALHEHEAQAQGILKDDDTLRSRRGMWPQTWHLTQQLEDLPRHLQSCSNGAEAKNCSTQSLVSMADHPLVRIIHLYRTLGVFFPIENPLGKGFSVTKLKWQVMTGHTGVLTAVCVSVLADTAAGSLGNSVM